VVSVTTTFLCSPLRHCPAHPDPPPRKPTRFRTARSSLVTIQIEQKKGNEILPVLLPGHEAMDRSCRPRWGKSSPAAPETNLLGDAYFPPARRELDEIQRGTILSSILGAAISTLFNATITRPDPTSAACCGIVDAEWGALVTNLPVAGVRDGKYEAAVASVACYCGATAGSGGRGHCTRGGRSMAAAATPAPAAARLNGAVLARPFQPAGTPLRILTIRRPRAARFKEARSLHVLFAFVTSPKPYPQVMASQAYSLGEQGITLTRECLHWERRGHAQSRMTHYRAIQGSSHPRTRCSKNHRRRSRGRTGYLSQRRPQRFS